uniref:Uncharacterized protein n=1 Tax=Arundo donax TaxID=35708 RepID=A0A0A9DL27_ARUDO
MIGYILKCTMSPYQNAACNTLPTKDNRTVMYSCLSRKKYSSSFGNLVERLEIKINTSVSFS